MLNKHGTRYLGIMLNVVHLHATDIHCNSVLCHYTVAYKYFGYINVVTWNWTIVDVSDIELDHIDYQRHRTGRIEHHPYVSCSCTQSAAEQIEVEWIKQSHKRSNDTSIEVNLLSTKYCLVVPRLYPPCEFTLILVILVCIYYRCMYIVIINLGRSLC